MSKILITGSVKGQFPGVFEKLSKLHAKKSFSLAIILGDLFADPAEASSKDEENVKSLVEGEISIPLPTYFTLGSHSLPPQVIEKLEQNEGEVCQNLYFLNKRSTTKTLEGLRIVTLGGTLDPTVTAGLATERFLPFHTEEDARALRGAKTADILITSCWPLSIRSGSRVNGPDRVLEEQCVADLCSALKPRYHFSTSDEMFYEREPFFHLTEQGEPETASITRFISLAAFDNPSKQKSLYAFSIDPASAPPSTLPPGTTASPLTFSKKPSLTGKEQSYSRFVPLPEHEHSRKRRRRQPPPTPQECFFCLANPNLATHLITSIASDSYLATAKGPLTNSSTFPSLTYPAHILIVPLAHSPTLSMIPDPESRASAVREMHQYRRALQSCLSHASNDVALGAVTWELSRAAGIHVHWQFLPVAAELVEKGLVAAAFRVEAENEKYAAFHPSPSISPNPNSTDTFNEGDYFRLWIWRPDAPLPAPHFSKEAADGTINPPAPAPPSVGAAGGGIEISLTLPIPPSARFDAQFGRRVMAKLLGLETRMDWRECGQEVDEERRDAEAFKKDFRPWDFSFDV